MTESNKTFRQKLGSLVWFRVLSYCLLPVYIFLSLMTVEYLNFTNFPDLWYMWRKPGKIFAAFIILAIFAICILLLSKKLWIFCAIYGPITIIIGLINCIKLAVNGDFFFPWDMVMIKNTGELLSFASFDIPPWFWLLLFGHIVFFLVFYFAGTDIPLKWYITIPISLLIIASAFLLYLTPDKVNKMFKPFGMSFNDSYLQSSNYRTNGFVNAFTINCYAMKFQPPEGYSEQKVATYLENYKPTKGTEKPDVIVVLSEAFTDIRKLEGTTFSQNPLENFDRISQNPNAATGKLYTTALGGGTVRTEIEILTGLSVDYLKNTTSPYMYVKKDLESYVSNYKSQGYKTIGLHAYDGKFYMRNIAYPYLGFDEFIAESDIYDMKYDFTGRRGYITDDSFTNVIIDQLEKSDSDANFVFAITMENHQPYNKSQPSELDIQVQNDSLTPELLESVKTYTQGIYNADKALAKLVDYIDSREKPTVLLFFGDHNPSLGPNQAAYKMAGNVTSDGKYTKEDYDFLYSTPYLVYSNYGADLTPFKDGEISTYYMLSLLADCTKTAKTPYMNYLLEGFAYLPKYSKILNITLDKRAKEFVRSLDMITYDRIK